MRAISKTSPAERQTFPIASGCSICTPWVCCGSFRPTQEVCTLRTLLRHRDNLIQLAATHVLHMHKALDQMNLQIHHVISDITGLTGLAIVDAILAGERDPKALA